MSDNQNRPDETPNYRSGAAAKLTGIPVETLRVWERRYKVVGPRQSASGQRLYSTADLARLALIKKLVDAGIAIGSIASLGLETLSAMRDQATLATFPRTSMGSPRTDGPTAPMRLAIVGQALALRVEHQHIAGLRVAAVWTDAEQALQTRDAVEADALLIEAPTLQAETAAAIRSLAQRLGAQRAIVEYGFAPQGIEQELRASGYSLVHAPMDFTQLGMLCGVLPAAQNGTAFAAPPRTDPAAPRRFDARALAEISMMSVALQCECPRHLADLLLRLGNFETYSGECASRSPADAELHQYLQQVCGNARAMLETALVHVAEAEGIALPS